MIEQAINEIEIKIFEVTSFDNVTRHLTMKDFKTASYHHPETRAELDVELLMTTELLYFQIRF